MANATPALAQNLPGTVWNILFPYMSTQDRVRCERVCTSWNTYLRLQWPKETHLSTEGFPPEVWREFETDPFISTLHRMLDAPQFSKLETLHICNLENLDHVNRILELLAIWVKYYSTLRKIHLKLKIPTVGGPIIPLILPEFLTRLAGITTLSSVHIEIPPGYLEPDPVRRELLEAGLALGCYQWQQLHELALINPVWPVFSSLPTLPKQSLKSLHIEGVNFLQLPPVDGRAYLQHTVFVGNFSALTHLECTGIESTPTDISTIGQRMPFLEVLKFRQIDWLENAAGIASLPHLRELFLVLVPGPTVTEVLIAITNLYSRCREKLQVLRLDYSYDTPVQGLSQIKRLPALRILGVQSVSSFNGEMLAGLAPFMTNLEILFAESCCYVTDQSLLILAQHCMRLRTLDISACHGVTVPGVEAFLNQLWMAPQRSRAQPFAIHWWQCCSELATPDTVNVVLPQGSESTFSFSALPSDNEVYIWTVVST